RTLQYNKENQYPTFIFQVPTKDNNSEENEDNSKKISLTTYHKVLNAVKIHIDKTVEPNN
ncbi:6808_t:CDS:2, partial [Cetraspora pellucida]